MTLGDHVTTRRLRWCSAITAALLGWVCTASAVATTVTVFSLDFEVFPNPQAPLLSTGTIAMTGDWTGTAQIGASEATPGQLYSILFEVPGSSSGNLNISSPGGGPGGTPLDVDIAANTVSVIDIFLDDVLQTFTFAVTGVGAGAQWTLQASIHPVPVPAAAWLFISALAGLVIIGRRRQMLAAGA